MLDYSKRRFDFLWVRWFKPLSSTNSWSAKRLDRITLEPVADTNLCGFIDPADVLRAAHIIPRFSQGTVMDEWEKQQSLMSPLKSTPKKLHSKIAQDHKDWMEYYVNRCVPVVRYMSFLLRGLFCIHCSSASTVVAEVTPLLLRTAF